jgi:hypothetical protein
MQVRISILFLFLLIFVSTKSVAQKSKNVKDATKLVGADTNYIVSYPQLLTFGIFTATPVMEVEVKPIDKNLSSYGSDFRGNFSDILGFTFAYRNIAINLGF